MRLGWPGTVLLLSGVLLLPREARPAAPVVRFLEVGERGTVFPDAPLFADVEVWSDAPFSGSLVATLRYGAARGPATGAPFVSDRVSHPIALATGQRRRLSLLFPESTFSWGDTFPFVEISWRLEDLSGREVAHGSEPARFEPFRLDRLLVLTGGPSTGFARPPEEAHSEVARYLPFAVVLVAGPDLEAMREDQRRALRDAAAIGLTVVIAGPLANPSAAVSGLAASERTVWSDGAAAEIREASLVRGRVRRTNLPILTPPRFEGTEDPRLLGYALATTPGNLLPGFFAAPRFLAGAGLLEGSFRDLRSRIRALLVAVPVFLVGTFIVLWAVSRPARPLGQRQASLALLVSLLATASLGAFSWQAAGHLDSRVEICIHDPGGRAAVLRSVQLLGGGGGGRRVMGTLRFDARTAFAAFRLADPVRSPRMDVEAGDDGSLRLSLPSDAWAGTNALAVLSDRVTDGDRAWDARLYWTGGRPTGSITFHRAFRRVVLIDRETAATIGGVREGETLDVGRFPTVPLDAADELHKAVDLAPLESLLPFASLPFSIRSGRRIGGTRIVAEEESRGGAVLHVESVRVAGRETEAFVTVPAFPEGVEVHAFVPALPGVTSLQFQGEGSTLGPTAREPRIRRPLPGATELVFQFNRRFEAGARPSRSDLPPGAGVMRFSVRTTP